MKSRGWWRNWTRIWVIGCLAIGLLGCQSGDRTSSLSARVSYVVSGQTIEIVNPTNQRAERVRLLGIEPPNQKQEPWSSQAKDRLQELLGDDRVVILESDLEPEVTTSNGTMRLAYVWKNGVLLNEQLVAEGVVLAASRSPNLRYEERLARAQEKARLSGVGIWNAENPMRQTPQEFRAAE